MQDLSCLTEYKTIPKDVTVAMRTDGNSKNIHGEKKGTQGTAFQENLLLSYESKLSGRIIYKIKNNFFHFYVKTWNSQFYSIQAFLPRK